MFLRIHNIIDYSLLLVIEHSKERTEEEEKKISDDKFVIDITDTFQNLDASNKKDRVRL